MNNDIKELRIATYKNALESHVQNDMDDIRDFFKIKNYDAQRAESVQAKGNLKSLYKD